MNKNNQNKHLVSQDEEREKFGNESVLETTLDHFKHFFRLYIKTINGKQYIFFLINLKLQKNRAKQN